MAHEGIFATLDEIMVKAGENVDVTGTTEARINALCLQAESHINIISRYNWSDNYAGLNADVKGILSDLESDIVGMYLVMFNMAGYTSRIEAEDMINVLWARSKQTMKLLADQKVVTFMKGA